MEFPQKAARNHGRDTNEIKTPRVSVVMPSYNHRRFLAEAVESVLNQSVRDIELIVVDDASTDGSRDLIQSYRQRDARVRAVFHPRNEGISRTFNDGIDLASGEYLAFLASDDLWLEHKLEEQLAAAQAFPGRVIWGDNYYVDGQGAFLDAEQQTAHRKREEIPALSGNLLDALLQGNFIFIWSLLLRRDILGDLRFDRDLIYLNDYKLVLDLAVKHDFHYVDAPLFKYRIHGANSILSNPHVWQRDKAKVAQHLLQTYGGRLPAKMKARLFVQIALCARDDEDYAAAARAMWKANLLYPLRIRYARLFFSALLRSWRHRTAAHREDSPR
jgi:glycosyltransferase involved in cell wall biosynthesis